MNYALYVLTGYLKGEKRALADAKQWFKERKKNERIRPALKNDVEVFTRSKKVAEKRIPELKEAISNITRMEQLKKNS